MSVMKAAVTDGQQISLGDFPVPEAIDTAIPIRMRGAALTNLDVITAEGRHYLSPKSFPAVVGNEGVATLPDGQRRYFPVRSLVAPFGSLAEYSLGRIDKSLPVPDGLPDGLAAALGNAGLAGWLPFSWQAALKAGETVLILGATGMTGLIAVAAARLLGAGRIIAAGRNREALAKAKTLGADMIVDLGDAAGWENALSTAVGGGIDIIVDYLNGPATPIALNLAAKGCRLVQIGSALGHIINLPAPLMRKQNLSVIGFAYYHAPHDKQVEAYTSLAQAALNGAILIDYEEMPLSAIEVAWQRQKSGYGKRPVLLLG